MKLKKLLLGLFIMLPIITSCAGVGEFSETSEDIIGNNLNNTTTYDEIYDFKQTGYIPSGYFIEDNSYKDYGLYILKDESNKIGFYSLPQQDFILKPKYNRSEIQYRILASDRLYVLAIKDDTNVMYYDNLGNLLITKGANSFSTSYINAKVVYKNNEPEIILSIFDQGGSFEPAFFKYDKLGNITTLKEEDMDFYEDKPKLGSYLIPNEAIDLSIIGEDDKLLVINNSNLATIYKNNKPVKSYSLESGDKNLVLSKYSLCQSYNLLPADAKEYDFIKNGAKYSLRSFTQNILDGKISDIDLNFIINYGEPLKNSKGHLAYSLVNINKIREDKTLDNEKTYVMNDSFVFIKELNTGNIQDFVKVGDNYFNTATELLVNKEGTVLAYLDRLSMLNPFAGDTLISGSLDDQFGALNSNGEVIAEFRHDDIYCIGNDNKYMVIGMNDNKCTIYEKDSKTTYFNAHIASKEGVIVLYTDTRVIIATPHEILRDDNIEGVTGAEIDKAALINGSSSITVLLKGAQLRFTYRNNLESKFHSN